MMKRSVIIIGCIIMVVAFTAFSLVSKSSYSNSVSSCKPLEKDFSTLGNDTLLPIDLYYNVRGKYGRSITKKRLNNAKLISDIDLGYPVNWITDYVSVEIRTTCSGKELFATSSNGILNEEQREIFHSVDLAAEINIQIVYKTKNAATNIIENREMNLSMTVVPELQAEYLGGYDEMIKYLKKGSRNLLTGKNQGLLQNASIFFTINEQGKTENVKLNKTSGDLKLDYLLIELINEMPGWKPAENLEGIKVNQEFEFTMGISGC